VLTLRHVQVKGERALRRWGRAESAARSRLWQLRHELHILILEDQPMNQLVIERQMARLGLRHDVVENGLLALKRMEDTEYSVILCDCSMPKMDGYEFTRTVRRREAAAGTRRVPIIALTANVFVEDVERCKAAGMDDFIAKPVDLESMTASILTWAGLSDGRVVKFPQAGPPAPTTTLDMQVLRAALGTSDPAMLASTYRLFLSESRKHAEAIAACAVLRIAADLKHLAHAAKGDARNAGATILADMLQALEQAATANDWQRVDVLAMEIAAEQVKVADFIEDHILSGAPAVCETDVGSAIADGSASKRASQAIR
jgi:two-component system sensor histidine kinase/response regulator